LQRGRFLGHGDSVVVVTVVVMVTVMVTVIMAARNWRQLTAIGGVIMAGIAAQLRRNRAPNQEASAICRGSS